MPALTHTHSYVKSHKQKSDGQQVWKCEDPKCTHLSLHHLVRGKLTLCPACREQEFVLEGRALKRTRPLCINCRNTKEAKEFRESKSLIEALFKPQQEITEQ